MTRRALLALLAAAALLSGCGHAAPATAAPRPASAAAARAEVPGGAAIADLLALPRFVRSTRGIVTDPVNVVAAADEAALVDAFTRAGWKPADPLTFKAVLKLIKTAVTAGEYPTAPISPLFLYDRRQDLAFQKNSKGLQSRDHLRIWRTPLLDDRGRPYWAISATRDASLGLNGLRPIHHIDPDLDAERKLVVDDLVATGAVARQGEYRAFEPGFRSHNNEGDPYFTDGRVIVLEFTE